ncbi:MAG: nitrile hydratase subunit beta, partial [Acidobacteria bacterium]|nr:nitrile hydratase subunit beta [Acidobacteriota bacterium]
MRKLRLLRGLFAIPALLLCLAALPAAGGAQQSGEEAKKPEKKKGGGMPDMGGMGGMGPIEPEPNEPVFHEPWEGRVFALFTRGMGPWGRGRNWGSFRFELESIPAAEYLRMSYYERWFMALLVNRLVKSGLVTQEELESGEADPNRPRPALLSTPPTSEEPDAPISPRFRP